VAASPVSAGAGKPRLGAWAATAMVVGEVVGVGIFLTPATMMRTLGTPGRALAIWAVMGLLSAAGALCYAELATRYPKAGGTYVFLREAFGPRCAFVYGWMALLVVDPGLTAALGIGFSQYVLAVTGSAAGFAVPLALVAIAGFGLLTLLGMQASSRLLRWSAVAKLAAVALVVVAAVARARGAAPGGTAGGAAAVTAAAAAIAPSALAGSFIAAFFAFGGWWDLGRMSEEVETPRRTMPRALLGGIALVTAIYVLVTATFVLTARATAVGSDQALVNVVGAGLFGDRAARLLGLIVVVAVSGSLAAVLLGAPRVYLAMARDGVFPDRLARSDTRRGTFPAATAVQVLLAGALVLLGTFDQILGFFVPGAVFFLGLSAAAVLVLPRPQPDAQVFRTPLHPLPILLFLVLIAAMLLLFAVGQTTQTMLGAAVIAAGVPVSWLVIPLPRKR
jgi:APA family basic amino acid/polyamine antiporter